MCFDASDDMRNHHPWWGELYDQLVRIGARTPSKMKPSEYEQLEFHYLSPQEQAALHGLVLAAPSSVGSLALKQARRLLPITTEPVELMFYGDIVPDVTLDCTPYSDEDVATIAADDETLHLLRVMGLPRRSVANYETLPALSVVDGMLHFGRDGDNALVVVSDGKVAALREDARYHANVNLAAFNVCLGIYSGYHKLALTGDDAGWMMLQLSKARTRITNVDPSALADNATYWSRKFAAFEDQVPELAAKAIAWRYEKLPSEE